MLVGYLILTRGDTEVIYKSHQFLDDTTQSREPFMDYRQVLHWLVGYSFICQSFRMLLSAAAEFNLLLGIHRNGFISFNIKYVKKVEIGTGNWNYR